MITGIMLSLLCLIVGFVTGVVVMRKEHKRQTAVLASIVRRLLLANNPDRAVRLLLTYEE